MFTQCQALFYLVQSELVSPMDATKKQLSFSHPNQTSLPELKRHITLWLKNCNVLMHLRFFFFFLNSFILAIKGIKFSSVR